MMEELSVVFFDLDNTLLDHNRATDTALVSLRSDFSDLLGSLSVNRLLSSYHQVNEELWQQYIVGKITQAELRVERFRQVILLAGSVPDPIRLRHCAEEFLDCYIACSILMDGALELLEILSSRYRLGIISNGFVSAQHGKLSITGIGRYFEDVIFSEAVGIMKPDPQIFNIASERFSVIPSEAIYIGDSFHHDIVGASNAGMKSIWFNSAKLHPPEGSTHYPNYTVHTLDEIVHLLLPDGYSLASVETTTSA